MDTFIPRAEFAKEAREPSSFALRTLAGNAEIQLAHFDFALVNALRIQLHPLHSHREIPDQSLFELTLPGKPWAHPKALDSEAVFLSLLSTIFAHGYSLISPIDYGKEEDGKLAIVFSKPHASPNHSSTSLPHHIPFAVSFPDKSTLRVINPPLHSTPAILQALRAAWPRGCSSENKLDGNSYEFKLKGYSILKEDTFPRDSLAHILSILSSLDAAGFTLLASLSVAGIHHRVKDLWIFAGRDRQSPSISAYDTSTGQNPEHIIPPSFVTGENHSTGLWGQYATDPAEEHQIDVEQDGPLKQAPFKVPKHAVLKKKNHQQEASLAKSEDGQGGSDQDLSQTQAGEICSRQYDPVPKDPETPARVLYSTPHPQTTNPDEMDAVPHPTPPGVSVLEPTESRDTEMATGLATSTLGGTTAVHAEAAEFGKPQEPNHNFEDDEFRNEQSENTHEKVEVDRPSDELLAEDVFRNTRYTSSFEQQHSTGSIPLLSTQNQRPGTHPLIPSPAVLTQSETHASGERLEDSSAAERPTTLKRQETPKVPGGWLHTPAEEKKESTNHEENHPLPTPETQNVPNYKPQTSQSTDDRASEAGILGHTPIPEVLLDSPKEGDLKVDEAVGVKAEDHVTPSSKMALEQAEAKVPPVMENEKGPAEVSVKGPGTANDAENVETLGAKTTPKRSVLKRIFHRQARSSSGSDGA